MVQRKDTTITGSVTGSQTELRHTFLPILGTTPSESPSNPQKEKDFLANTPKHHARVHSEDGSQPRGLHESYEAYKDSRHRQDNGHAI